MVEQALAVILVLVLLAALMWVLRGRGLAYYRGPARRKSEQDLTTIARLRLTPQHSLHWVRVSNHSVLLAVSPSGCTLVERLDAAAPADADLTGARTGAAQ